MVDSLIIFLKHKLKNHTLLETEVFCRLKEDEGRQFWFSFIHAYNSTEMLLKIVHYKNYMKEHENPIKISDFGNSFITKL